MSSVRKLPVVRRRAGIGYSTVPSVISADPGRYAALARARRPTV